MTDDIYGDAYEAFIDEIYKNGGGEPSAVRAAVDCATKSLTAERDALRDLLREAREYVADMPIVGDELLARIDAALKGGRE